MASAFRFETAPLLDDGPLFDRKGHIRSGAVLHRRYRVGARIAYGGMSSVYEGRDLLSRRRIAIQMLEPPHRDDGTAMVVFLQAMQAACVVRHPNLVRIYDAGLCPGGWAFSVMEFLDGPDLASLVEMQGSLRWGQAKPFILQLCGALAALHGAGVIHRDVKPENCCILPGGHLKLFDLGISRVVASPTDELHGLQGERRVWGTPQYIAPEQATNPELADARSDVYSAGALLYALLTGQVPFRGDTLRDTLAMQMHVDPTPPSQVSDEVPEALDAVILRALRKSPGERYSSIRGFAEELAAIDAPQADAPVRRRTFPPTGRFVVGGGRMSLPANAEDEVAAPSDGVR